MARPKKPPSKINSIETDSSLRPGKAGAVRTKLKTIAPKLRATFKKNLVTMLKRGRFSKSTPVTRAARVTLGPALLSVDETLDESQLAALSASLFTALPQRPGEPPRYALSLASANGNELAPLQSELSRFERSLEKKRRA